MLLPDTGGATPCWALSVIGFSLSWALPQPPRARGRSRTTSVPRLLHFWKRLNSAWLYGCPTVPPSLSLRRNNILPASEKTELFANGNEPGASRRQTRRPIRIGL